MRGGTAKRVVGKMVWSEASGGVVYPGYFPSKQQTVNVHATAEPAGERQHGLAP